MSDVIYATGRRKSSSARIFLKPGSGKMTVNGKQLDEYIVDATRRQVVLQALDITKTRDKFDIYVTVTGGGLSGQAGAIRHGIARALNGLNQEEYRPALKKEGLLTRDARKVERKKYGLKKARKSSQFSKR